MSGTSQRASVVLVHGGFVDGSGWQGVYAALRADGYDVGVVQNPTLTLQQRRGLHPADPGRPGRAGRAGGSLLRRRGHHRGRHPPERGRPGLRLRVRPGHRGVGRLSHRRVPGRRAAAADPAAQQRLPFPRPESSSTTRSPATCPPSRPSSWLTAQVPWGVGATTEAITEAAWRTKPSWYLNTTEDRMIPSAAQAAMADRIGARVSQVAASHAVYVSQPEAVVSVIAEAAA